MHKIVFFGVAVAILTCLGPAFAQQTAAPLQTVTLQDGSVLKGSLESVEGEYYVIRTQKLGTLRVHRSDLKSMNTGTSSPKTCALPQQNMPVMTGFNQLQQQLMNDPGILSLVQEIAADPETVQLLKNPRLITLLTNADPSQVQNDPTIQQLMANPKMKRLMESISLKLGIGSQNGLPSDSKPSIPQQ